MSTLATRRTPTMLKTQLTPELYAYCLTKGVRESTSLQQLRLHSQNLNNGRMLITPEQGSLLAMLAQLSQARSYLEIGMFSGYSTLWVAAALPADGQVVTLDLSDQHLDLARRYWHEAGCDAKIQVRLGEAILSLQQLQQQQQLFDLVLIDANKSQYLEYYEAALALTRPGGLIVIDNVLMYGQVLETHPNKNYVKVLQQLNELLQTDSRVDICLLPIGDGMTLARKKEHS